MLAAGRSRGTLLSNIERRSWSSTERVYNVETRHPSSCGIRRIGITRIHHGFNVAKLDGGEGCCNYVREGTISLMRLEKTLPRRRGQIGWGGRNKATLAARLSCQHGPCLMYEIANSANRPAILFANDFV